MAKIVYKRNKDGSRYAGSQTIQEASDIPTAQPDIVSSFNDAKKVENSSIAQALKKYEQASSVNGAILSPEEDFSLDIKYCVECGDEVCDYDEQAEETHGAIYCDDCMYAMYSEDSAKNELDSVVSYPTRWTPQNPPIYHGTKAELDVGDVILPASQVGKPINWVKVGDPEMVFATESLASAQWFAAASKGLGQRKIYEVVPYDVEETLWTRDLTVRDETYGSDMEAPCIEHSSRKGFVVVKEIEVEGSTG